MSPAAPHHAAAAARPATRSSTWDRDYSTYNGSPGFETGWDWNLDTRVFPAHGLVAVAPRVSRVRNIGEVGERGTPEDLVPAPSFVAHQARRRYREE